MKRIFSVLLIALLLIFPVFSVQADDKPTYVFVDDGLLTADELGDLNTRAFMISLDRHVGVYYFYYSVVEDLPSYVEQFASEHVSEENALVLGVNADSYYFLRIGSVAEEALPDDICEGIYDAYNAVKGDPKGKLLAYLNTADEILKAYRDAHGFPDVVQPISDPYDLSDVPEEIARTDGGKPTVVDRAHLLSDSQAEALSKRLAEIGTAYRCDVVVVTVNSLEGKTAEAYADDWFDYHGYGYGATPTANGTTVDGDGILLLVSMEDRDYWVSTSGYAIKAFTDYGIQEYLEPMFLTYLSSGDYGEALERFADGCGELLKMARDGDPYDCFHIVTDEGYLSDSERTTLQAGMVRIFNQYDTILYFIYKPSVTDPDAYVQKLYDEYRIPHTGSTLVFISNGDEYDLKTYGEVASKVQEKDLEALKNTASKLQSEQVSQAVESFTKQSETILSRRPVNWFTLALGVLTGGLFGFVPVSKMKRQLTDVSKQTNADKYLEPNSFALTQNSDVLLGSHVSRTVHVAQQSSSSGGRSGGGGGFHGGSSTHTSSSGGTHGGHGGKF